MRQPGSAGHTVMLVILSAAVQGCVWTVKGDPYPEVGTWPPVGLSKQQTIGITVKTSLFLESNKSYEEIEFEQIAHRAAYNAFKESRCFREIQVRSHEGVDYWADITVLKNVSDPPGWWVPASLFLIPSKGESVDLILTQLYNKQGVSLGSFSRKAVIGGYVQLLFILLWPLEQLSGPYSQERAMYDAHRAIILEAVDKGIWSGT